MMKNASVLRFSPCSKMDISLSIYHLLELMKLIFSKLGYSPKRKYNDGMWRRALYENVSEDHFFQLALNTKFRRFKLGVISWWINPIKALRSNLGSNKLIRTAFFEKTLAITFATFHLHELKEPIFSLTWFDQPKQRIMLVSEEMQFVKMCLDIF